MKFDAILLVDDDESTNYLHTMYLEEWEVTESIHTALNGQEAIDFLKTNEEFRSSAKSLILLDVNMPIMNGFEFLEQYETLPEEFKATIVVVMLTSSLHAKDQATARGFGDLGGYINKPLSYERMVEIMKELEGITVE